MQMIEILSTRKVAGSYGRNRVLYLCRADGMEFECSTRALAGMTCVSAPTITSRAGLYGHTHRYVVCGPVKKGFKLDGTRKKPGPKVGAKINFGNAEFMALEGDGLPLASLPAVGAWERDNILLLPAGDGGTELYL